MNLFRLIVIIYLHIYSLGLLHIRGVFTFAKADNPFKRFLSLKDLNLRMSFQYKVTNIYAELNYCSNSN